MSNQQIFKKNIMIEIFFLTSFSLFIDRLTCAKFLNPNLVV